MNKIELIAKLAELGVDPNTYSLEGELLPDSIVLYHSYSSWEVFYLDERGGRNKERVFSSERLACDHIYRLFREAQEISDRVK